MAIEINLLAYRQMQAREIYVSNSEWKKLFDEFQRTPDGIYFYTYDDAEYPFYIGICRAKSYNIAGRIWAELDDYKEGQYWFVRDLEKLRDLSCFKKGIAKSEWDGLFFPPGQKPPEDHFEKFLDKVWITFTQVEKVNPEASLESIEAALQDHLVNKLGLVERWIGDGGKALAKVNDSSTNGLVVKFTLMPGQTDWEILRTKFFSAFSDIGQKSLK